MSRRILHEVEHYGSAFFLEADWSRPGSISFEARLHRRRAADLCCYGPTPALALRALERALDAEE